MPDGRGPVLARPTAPIVGMLVVVAWLWPVAAGAEDVDDTPSELDVAGAVRFEPVEVDEDDALLFSVDGEHRFLDTLELRPDGPTLVNELPIDDYVEGVAEMPSRWPSEALKAQAVAARTYAWYSMRLGSFDGYDICATTACQVFRGAETVLDGGDRWRQAVEDTAGEVLVTTSGEPILARYFSTSGGRTYANDEVFPSSGPRDYLVAIDDPDDEVSPYHRWTVRFTREEFDEVLARGDTLAAAVPVASVERLGEVRQQDADLRVTGADGTSVDVGADDLRSFISRVAPERFPDRFPTVRSDGLRPLPSTIPSTRFDIEVGDDEVVVTGQGWGHGVGMGQYGARGRAERGEGYLEILAAYYDGLAPTVDPHLPDRIRVGLDVDDEVAVRATGPMRLVTADGDVLVERALGAWTAVRAGDGWNVQAPPGTGDTLEVSTTRAASDLAALRDAVTVEVDVNKPALLRLEVRDPDDVVVVQRDLGVGDPGTHTATWRFVDADGDGVDAGDYDLTLLAEDAAGVTQGSPVTITVTEDASRAAEGDGQDGAGGLVGILVVVAVAAVALPIALVIVVLATRKART